MLRIMSRKVAKTADMQKVAEVEDWTFIDSEESSLMKAKVHKPKTTVEELQDENDILREENDELRSIVDHLRGYIRSIEAKHNAELEKSLSKGSDDASANVKPQCAFCNDPNCHLKKKCAKPPYQSNKVN